MFKLVAVLAVISIGFTVWCLVEAISTSGSRVRTLPKLAWILLILLLPLVGAIAWFVAGRPSAAAAHAATPGPDRVTRRDATNPAEEAADFTTRIRERAEEQRRRYQQQKQKDQKKKDEERPEADQ